MPIRIVIILLSSSPVVQSLVESDYSNPNNWFRKYPACGGMSQSPIDLPPTWSVKSADFTIGRSSKRLRASDISGGVEYDILGGSEWISETPHRLTVFHNGTQFALQVPKSMASLRISQYSETYNLRSMHIHTPSEHTVNGKRFPLELHLVHLAEIESEDGGKEEREAVISLLFAGTTNTDPRILPAADAFLNEYAIAGSKDANNKPISLSLHKLGEEMENIKWERYIGSVTTPPCTEGVHWIVSEPVHIHADILDWLHTDVGSDNNRPMQALNGRDVHKAVVFLKDDYEALMAQEQQSKTRQSALEIGAAAVFIAITVVVLAVSIYKKRQLKRLNAAVSLELQSIPAGESATRTMLDIDEV